MSDNKMERASNMEQNQKNTNKMSFDYDEAYNWSIERKFFEPSERFIEPVYVFSDELHVLYKFYEYSYRHMVKYMEEEKVAYDNTNWNDAGEYAYEYEMFFREMMYTDEEYMLAVNHEAVLLLLYALFENFLKALVKMLEKDNKVQFTKDKRKKAIVEQYIDFLRNDCGMGFLISKKLRKRLQLMRKIRNYFVHDYKGGGKIDLKLYEDCKPLPSIEDNQIDLSYDYVISCFETVGKISSVISETIE